MKHFGQGHMVADSTELPLWPLRTNTTFLSCVFQWHLQAVRLSFQRTHRYSNPSAGRPVLRTNHVNALLILPRMHYYWVCVFVRERKKQPLLYICYALEGNEPMKVHPSLRQISGCFLDIWHTARCHCLPSPGPWPPSLKPSSLPWVGSIISPLPNPPRLPWSPLPRRSPISVTHPSEYPRRFPSRSKKNPKSYVEPSRDLPSLWPRPSYSPLVLVAPCCVHHVHRCSLPQSFPPGTLLHRCPRSPCLHLLGSLFRSPLTQQAPLACPEGCSSLPSWLRDQLDFQLAAGFFLVPPNRLRTWRLCSVY